MRALLFIAFCLYLNAGAAQVSAHGRVSFKDKGQVYSVDRPEEFLSARAIERRQKQSIELNESDLPVNPMYLKDISSFGKIQMRSVSKWFNDCVIELEDTSVIAKIRDMDFVKDVLLIPAGYTKHFSEDQSKLRIDFGNDIEKAFGNFGYAYNQSHMIGCDYLHELGFRGRGMLVAVIDAGFVNYQNHAFLTRLQADSRVIDTRDFIERDKDVFQQSSHGTFVLTTLAADLPGNMVGTAPDASYLLLRSEDGTAEYLLEEYFWVEAAEFADSAGADVLNTSLGYTLFDDSLQDHKLSDMDGKSTRISLGADEAAKRGMLLFNSAGNSGNNSWQKIGAPADAFSLIAVGAVDALGNVAGFSSRGPTADGRIKPDLCAMGNNVVIGSPDGTARASNGTSFSSPVLTGMATCLWQANPEYDWKAIKKALIESGHVYHHPDTNQGHGIPNAIIADSRLKGRVNVKDDNGPWYSISPNPFHNKIILTYTSKEDVMVNIRFSDINGRIVGKTDKWLSKSEASYLVLEGNDIPSAAGTYIAEFKTGDAIKTLKVVKY